MADRQINIGNYAAENQRAQTQRKRLFFWLVSGALIALVAWFVTIPALLYDTGRPARAPQTRGLP